ncbi:23S rRNA (guanosine-2'-O-)-methyltransferase RlmB [Austwickia sp. TVS 96-490-7B]|uniref:TrmH family RNA methyltransferase n=1 Tax=Austwickia sp. TVS 96-490-7B TaxID=2830843 RepID=UPI001C55C9E9|nr:RNA methyltransferase [Austwickia sp. TVS 96-490-7B]MBW3084032.1 23S rRNA (guanosine-2'-O-)-methyltransferase RlmB [Austwickia sp. TVS 96-490-7B]
MSDDLFISSPANPRLKSLVALRRRRVRDLQGLTLLEGLAETGLAVAAGVRPQCVYWCPELAGELAATETLISLVAQGGGQVVRLSRQAFEKVAYREGPDGVLAVVSTPGRALAELALPESPLVLIAQGVEKPGNLGAMLRTADAAGVAAVVSADPVTDWGNPNVVRSSKGAVFSVPVAAASWPDVSAWASDRGLALVATTPETQVGYAQVDYTGGVALMVGAEKTGLTPEALAAAHHRVRIPMSGRVDSLNVATSAAIVLYEAVRQRSVTSGADVSGVIQ